MAKDIQSSIKATRDSTKKRKRKAGGEEEDDRGAPSEASKSSKVAVKELDGKALKREREILEKKAAGPVDFQKAETRKRVNDIVLAPPVLTRAPRGESKQAKERKANLQSLMTGKDISAATVQPARLPNPVQKGGLKREAMLQQERDRVVQAYRDKKQASLRIWQ